MLDAVFISDLHLNVDEPLITKRFEDFLQWARLNTRSIYILGDFLHVWAGDDSLTSWSAYIAKLLSTIVKAGVDIYFMAGNRDFLLGKKFLHLAGLKELTDPSVILLGNERVLLTHGDALCTNDKMHQRLRKLTRNRVFTNFFLNLPLNWRQKCVHTVRQHSKQRIRTNDGVISATLISIMQKFKVQILIHGHTHTPGLVQHIHENILYQQYVLSDWDDNPIFMCYDNTKGLFYKRN